MEAIKFINVGIRFLLELCILAIFGFWGFKTSAGTVTKILLGLGAPILFAVVWGIFLAPKSSMRLGEPWLFLLEVVIFGLTCWMLYSTGKTNLAFVFGSIYILNKVLMVIWRQ